MLVSELFGSAVKFVAASSVQLGLHEREMRSLQTAESDTDNFRLPFE